MGINEFRKDIRKYNMQVAMDSVTKNKGPNIKNTITIDNCVNQGQT